MCNCTPYLTYANIYCTSEYISQKPFGKKLIWCLISKTRWQKYICGSHKSRKYDLFSIREANKRIYFLRIPSVFTLECYESILRVECGMLSCFRTSLFPSNTLCISLNNLYYTILYTRNNKHVLNYYLQNCGIIYNIVPLNIYCYLQHYSGFYKQLFQPINIRLS